MPRKNTNNGAPVARLVPYLESLDRSEAKLAAQELRTTPANARRALEDTVRMDVLARDLAITDRSLVRVFDSVKSAGLVPADAVYDRQKFVDESFLADSR